MLCSLSMAADKFQYYYIEAVRQQNMGNFATAYELFQRCLEINPEASEAQYVLGIFYVALEDYEKGILYLKKATQLAPDNREYSERLAQVYSYQNKLSDAAEVFEELSKKHPDHSEYLEILSRIYQQQKDYPKLLSVLDRMEIQEGTSEELTLDKMNIHALMDDSDGAYKELQSLIDAHPFDLNLQVMKGNWLLNNNRKEEALNTFNKVLEEEPDNAQAQMSLMDFYRANNENGKADELLYKMLINPRTEPNNRVDLIRRWVADSEEKGGDSLRVMQVFNKVLAMPQTTSEVAEMKAAYLNLKGAPSDAVLEAWRDVLNITPENISARLQVIQIMWNDTVDVRLIEECKKATEYVPDEPLLYLYLSTAQHINKQIDDAITTLQRAIAHITANTDKDVCADIYESLGDIYQSSGRLQLAFASYEKALEYNPDKVMLLNNYAYALAVHGKDLKRAEKMSYRAISKEPNMSIYLDTYAWILYMQKRYDDANAYIDMALENLKEDDDKDGVIADHAKSIKKKLKK